MPFGHQRIVKDRDHPVLQIAVHIDQQIPAGDHVDPGERRIADQAVGGEGAEFANFLADQIAVGPSAKNRDRRSGVMPSSKVAGNRPARAVPIAISSMSLAKIWTFGDVASLSMCSRSRIASE